MKKMKHKKTTVKKLKLFSNLLMFFLIIILNIKTSNAIPSVPSQYYGLVYINDEKAPIGTIVYVYDSNDILCGLHKVNEDGKYVVSCKGDDLSTFNKKEGARQNEEIKIFVNENLAITSTQTIWKSGSFNEIDLNYRTKEFVNEMYSKKKFNEKIYKISFLVFGFVFVILLLILIFLQVTNKKR
jgi:hypothetical protein